MNSQVTPEARAKFTLYMHALKQITDDFPKAARGMMLKAVNEATDFIFRSTHWEHAYIHQDISIDGLDRLELEQELVERCRGHTTEVSHELAKLVEHIKNHENISRLKRDAEKAACPNADRQAFRKREGQRVAQ